MMWSEMLQGWFIWTALLWAIVGPGLAFGLWLSSYLERRP